MDPFTQKLLEKTRQRREQLQQKLQSTPSSATRKRKPLQTDTGSENVTELPVLGGSNDVKKIGEKRRKSSTSVESVPYVIGSDSTKTSGSGAAHCSASKENIRRGASGDAPSPTPATRKGRLQRLAAQINNWEDDLSHPQTPKVCSIEKVQQTAASGGSVKPADTAKPPKPPRAFQSESHVTETSTRRSPRISKQAGSGGENNAFSFGVAGNSAPGTRASPARPSKPPTPKSDVSNVEARSSTRQQSDDEPTQKAVADRFSMWQKKTGDSLTPLRQATPLQKATPLRTVKNAPAGAANSTSKSLVNRSASNQSQTSQFKPIQPQQTSEARPARTRRRSRSAAPTPERERTGASAPWRTPAAAPSSAVSSTRQPGAKAAGQFGTPQQRNGGNDDEWCKTQDTAFQKAPMSARKFAWEAKIAEQQTVASEHNRIMYRTRSATRLEGTPCQKQDAEDLLRQGQEKVYDPAERAKRERQAELESLQNRFTNKGLLKSAEKAPHKVPQPASSAALPVKAAAPASKPVATSMESLEDQEYFTASDSELAAMPSSSNNATAGSSADEMKKLNRRQVSFKSPTRAAAEQRKSDSSPESDQQQERKIKRRSSYKIPKLGYDSSSDDDDEEEVFLKPKAFPVHQGERASPNKIPRLGDESSVDSLDGDMRQTSGSSIGSSVSSYSYYFVNGDEGTPTTNSRDVADFLDEAMSDGEPTPEPRRVKPSPAKRRTPERRETRASGRNVGSPAFSIDQYRQKTKSVAVLPPSSTEMRRPKSRYDTDESTMSDDTSSSQYSMTDSDRRARVKELQALVKQEQNVIVQASNALNQCCQSGSNFAGSTEQVECNRLLLIACQRRQAYLSEIERIKANPHTYEQRKGKGSLTISDIQLPLKRDFVKKMGTPDDDTTHYFLLMVRAGAQVIVTQMVSTHDALVRGTLNFPNLIKLNDIMNDFRYELEIYGMQVGRVRDPLKQSGKKEKKKSSSSRGRDGSSNVRTTSFTHITSLMLTMDCVKHSAFKLSRVPYLSPLHGTMHMTLRCTMETNVVFKGFINMFEDVGGFGAWHRRWCVLNNNLVSYWKYPDDERSKEPIGALSLKDCVTTEVGLVSRDKCARPNTIELMTVRPASRSETTSGMNKQIRDRIIYEHHWFGMDTKSDRVEWCVKLNEALANVRQWYSDAARPVPSQRTVI